MKRGSASELSDSSEGSLLPSDGKEEKRENVGWACFANFLFNLAIMLIVPLYPAVVETMTNDSALTSRYLGGMFAINAATSFLMNPLVGMWADRIGYKKALLLLDAWALAATAAISVSVHFKWLWVLFGVRCFNISFAVTIAQAYIADLSRSQEERTKYFSYNWAFFYVAVILGPIVSGILSNYNLVYPFLLSGAVQLVNIIYSAFALTEKPPNPKEFQLPYREMWEFMKHIWSDKAWLALLVLQLMMSIGSQDINELFFLYAPKHFSLSLTQLGLLISTIATSMALWQGAIFSLIINYGKPSLYIPASTLATVLQHIGFGLVIQWWLFIPLLFLTGFGRLTFICLDSMTSARASEDQQGLIMGIISSFQTLGQILGGLGASFLFAAVIDGDPNFQSFKAGAPFYAGASIEAVAFFVWIWWFQNWTWKKEDEPNLLPH